MNGAAQPQSLESPRPVQRAHFVSLGLAAPGDGSPHTLPSRLPAFLLSWSLTCKRYNPSEWRPWGVRGLPACGLRTPIFMGPVASVRKAAPRGFPQGRARHPLSTFAQQPPAGPSASRRPTHLKPGDLGRWGGREAVRAPRLQSRAQVHQQCLFDSARHFSAGTKPVPFVRAISPLLTGEGWRSRGEAVHLYLLHLPPCLPAFLLHLPFKGLLRWH